jgi:hypothetical protein
VKGFLEELTTKKTRELLLLNINQLRHLTGILEHHCHLNGHLFKMGPVNIPTSERCHEKGEKTSHVLW